VKILSVVGNRPQFIKSAPLSVALRERGIQEISLHTGQHYDPELSQIFYVELGLPDPRYSLAVGGVSQDEMLERMRPGLLEAIDAEQPDRVLVFGDTTSTLAGARAAKEAGAFLAHVEAGMRSGDWSMPEEHIRVEVDRISDLLFCPDERSAGQLATEGVEGRSEVVGDVMADATRIFAPIAAAQPTVADRFGDFVVLTIHREANTEADQLKGILAVISSIEATFVFPAHPRTRRVIEEERIELAPGVHLIEPVGYLDMLALVQNARAVVTDSGGLQKEAYWLKTPCVTLRPSTEWVNTVEAGANTLVDPADPTGLAAALRNSTFPADAPPLYGDGHASERVADALYA
jgi:UDP-N-acetylglucosamine 2-epimerase